MAAPDTERMPDGATVLARIRRLASQAETSQRQLREAVVEAARDPDVSRTDIAAAAGISRDTFYRWIVQG